MHWTVLQEVEKSFLSMKLAKNENGSVNGWERQWRDRMPSSTRMWRAVSEQKKMINPLVLSAAARRRAAD